MRKYLVNYLLLSLISCLMLTSCGPKAAPSPSASVDSPASKKKDAPLRDSTAKVLVPEATGVAVYTSDTAAIDASNSSEGYIMVRYNGDNKKVKLQITVPSGVNYTYLLSGNDLLETFPLTEGNGAYQITVYENISGDQYAAILAQGIDVTIADEFKPFLYPNQYVNFTAQSAAVAKGSELSKKASSDLDAVSLIYNYVIKNITYDTALADNISYGYLPNVDDTLTKKTGICFDYAALMTAMLRSQRIPTKLEVGYSGDTYHAWISTYVDDIGWVDNVIEFNGSSWSLMDPTLAASNKAKNVKKYVGDGDNYLVKYTY